MRVSSCSHSTSSAVNLGSHPSPISLLQPAPGCIQYRIGYPTRAKVPDLAARFSPPPTIKRSRTFLASPERKPGGPRARPRSHPHRRFTRLLTDGTEHPLRPTTSPPAPSSESIIRRQLPCNLRFGPPITRPHAPSCVGPGADVSRFSTDGCRQALTSPSQHAIVVLRTTVTPGDIIARLDLAEEQTVDTRGPHPSLEARPILLGIGTLPATANLIFIQPKQESRLDSIATEL